MEESNKNFNDDGAGTADSEKQIENVENVKLDENVEIIKNFKNVASDSNVENVAADSKVENATSDSKVENATSDLNIEIVENDTSNSVSDDSLRVPDTLPEAESVLPSIPEDTIMPSTSTDIPIQFDDAKIQQTSTSEAVKNVHFETPELPEPSKSDFHSKYDPQPSTSTTLILPTFDSDADIAAFFDNITNSDDEDFDNQSVTLELRSEVSSSAAASSSDESDYDPLPLCDMLTLALEELDAATPKGDALQSHPIIDPGVPSTSTVPETNNVIDIATESQEIEPSQSTVNVDPAQNMIPSTSNNIIANPISGSSSEYANLPGIERLDLTNHEKQNESAVSKHLKLAPSSIQKATPQLLQNVKEKPNAARMAPPIPSQPKPMTKYEPPRIISKVTIAPLQFRPYPGKLMSPDSRISILVKMDDDEVLQTMAVCGTPVCIFGDKIVVDIYRSNQLIKLTVLEHLPNYQVHQIGRLRLRRKDILAKNGAELTLPVETTQQASDTVTVLFGEICLSIMEDSSETALNDEKDIITVSVLDYTITQPFPIVASTSSTTHDHHQHLQRRGSSTSTTSLGRSSSPSSPPLSESKGQAYLAVCATAYGETISPMSTVPLLGRRSTNVVTLSRAEMTENCRILRDAQTTSKTSINSSTLTSPEGKENQNTKNTASRNRKSTPNSTGNGSSMSDFPSAPLPSPVRLNIKIYSDPSYSEASYVGFARIPLDAESFTPIESRGFGANWYEIKSRMTISHNSTPAGNAESAITTSQYDSLDNAMPSTSTSRSVTTTTVTSTTTAHSPGMVPMERVGDLKIQFWYSIEHILSLTHYDALYNALIASLTPEMFKTSLASILQHLSIDLGHVARPLMKIYLKNGRFTEYFRLICRQYMSYGRETSTLFRNQSMTSKLMHEMMKFVGGDYLITTMKPVIDLVYAEKKRCEIDPSKLRPGDNLEENIRNVAVYAELTFVRVCESAALCPPILRNVFGVLREVVAEYYPERVEVSRLAVSSFIIMRFFAAAILSPTQYGLKRKSPDPDIARSLVLISKILQRLANCVVSQNPLTIKEPWLSRVLERFTDAKHRAEMIAFFDAVSTHEAVPTPPMSRYSSTNSNFDSIVKCGQMVERRCGSGRRKSIKDFIIQKKRFVTLTHTELSWQKVKDKDPAAEYEQKGTINVSDITAVAQLHDMKTSFRVATPHQEVHFQANNSVDMAEWIILLTTHQRKHLFCHNNNSTASVSPNGGSGQVDAKLAHHIDLEKELETLHTLLIENIESFMEWKDALDAMDINSDVSAGDKFPQIMFLNMKDPTCRKAQRDRLSKTLTDVLLTVQKVEEVHQQALAIAANMQNLQPVSKADKTAPNGLTDNENYLLMRSERNLKARMIPSHMAS